MIIKDEFSLLKGTKNVVNVSQDRIDEMVKPENSTNRVLLYLHTNKRSIKYTHVDKIIKKDFIENFNILVEIPNYPLPITYNKRGNKVLVNLKYFGVDELPQIDPKTLFSCMVYGDIFRKLVTKEERVKENYAYIFINYYLSLFIRVFGKQFGLLGTYTREIPKLKFLISIYILESFFGISGGRNYRQSGSLAQVDFRKFEDDLKKYDFSDVSDFIKALSDFKVMVGINKYRFTEKILKFFTINFIPAVEDCSRFVASITSTTVPGSKLIPGFIYRYNENEYKKIIDLGNNILKK